MASMRIGALAEATGCTVETIRYYEREGLLKPAPRTDGNYRLYGGAELGRLRFIRRCRSLDMAHDEIRALLNLLDAPQGECAEVNHLLDEHIGHVGERIAVLQALQRDLVTLRRRCKYVRKMRECGILQALTDDAPVPSRTDSGHVHRTHR